MLGPLLLATATLAPPPLPIAAVEVSAGPTIVARLPRAILAVAFAGPGRVLLLEDDRVSLWKLTPEGLSRQAELPLPAPTERTRRPGGLIRVPAGTPDFWVLRSGWPGALLFTYEDTANGVNWIAKGGADAIPWPQASEGLRFRPGTNVLQGAVEGLPATSHLALSADGAVGINAEDRLHHADGGGPVRVGSAVARPWADVALASAPATTSPDSLLAVPLPVSDSAPPSVLARIDGAITALATLVEKDSAVVLAVVDAGDGGHLLMRVDLRRRALR